MSERMASSLKVIENSPNSEVLPVTIDIAREISVIFAPLRDAFDATIVATARVHRLKLLTSDQRIIESGLVSVVE